MRVSMCHCIPIHIWTGRPVTDQFITDPRVLSLYGKFSFNITTHDGMLITETDAGFD